MMVKVCGITTQEQALEISEFVDFIGFIFYSESKRSTQNAFPSLFAKKTGIFVNDEIKRVIRTAQLEKLDAVQLHGNETPEFCAEITSQITVIKAFGIDATFDFSELDLYAPFVDYFLFDTKTATHGGSGTSFDWELLDNYNGNTPFLLSGGIEPKSLQKIKSISHPKLIGIDLNSGFEVKPGIKNIDLLKQFIHDLKS